MRRKRHHPPLSGNGKNATCFWCKRQLESVLANSTVRATRDHVVPASQGGRSRVWACFSCNNLKGDMSPDAWRAFMAANPGWWKTYPRHPTKRARELDTLRAEMPTRLPARAA